MCVMLLSDGVGIHLHTFHLLGHHGHLISHVRFCSLFALIILAETTQSDMLRRRGVIRNMTVPNGSTHRNGRSVSFNKIRVDMTNGPTAHCSGYVLEVFYNDKGDLKNCRKESILDLFSQNTGEAMLGLHNLLIETMCLWPAAFRQWVRSNCRRFNYVLPGHIEVGDIVLFEGRSFKLDWRPNSDEELYFAENYISKIDVIAGFEINLGSSKDSMMRGCDNWVFIKEDSRGNEIKMYFSEEDLYLATRFRHRSPRNILPDLLIKRGVYDTFYTHFRHAASHFAQWQDDYLGSTFIKDYTIAQEPLQHIVSYFNLVPNKRRQKDRNEYSIHLKHYEAIPHLFGRSYFKKQKKDQLFYIEPITLNFSVHHRKLRISGQRVKEDAHGYVFGDYQTRV